MSNGLVSVSLCVCSGTVVLTGANCHSLCSKKRHNHLLYRFVARLPVSGLIQELLFISEPLTVAVASRALVLVAVGRAHVGPTSLGE